MIVKWKEDQRPTPDHAYYEEMAWDTNFIYEHQGKVISSHKTFLSGWILLVLCDDNKLRDVSIDKVEILEA